MNILKDSINQWCLGKCHAEELPNYFSIGGSTCWYSRNTECLEGSSDGRKVVILGTCVDVEGRIERKEIAQRLCELDFGSFEKAVDGLCGVYVIFREDNNGEVFVFGDAIHMLSIYYGTTGPYKGIAASSESLIVDDAKVISAEGEEMDRCAFSSGRYLAGDLTMYEGVRCLLPNHYLDVSRAKAVRYFPRGKLQPAKSVDEVDAIIDDTVRLVGNVITQFAKTMKFASPLTPGGDSRVNCAFLRKIVPDADVLYYTLRTYEVSLDKKNEEFIVDLAGTMGIKDFHVYPILQCLTEDQLLELQRVCGPTRPWDRTIWTYHPAVGMHGDGRTIVSGQLIGHLLGSAAGRGKPEWLLPKLYIRALQGNTSNAAAKAVSRWYEEAIDKGNGYSVLDLWLWEIRCGRWNSNLISINSLLGIRDVNFYNSTRIISEWCRIPRRLRVAKRKPLHIKLIERLLPDVADIPFNPDYLVRGSSEHLPAFASKIVPLWCRAIARYYYNKARGFQSV